MSSAESHPYYPPGVDIPGYAPNTMPLWRMLAPFGAMAGAAVVSAHRLAARNPRLGAGDRFSASWFALCEMRPFLSFHLNLPRLVHATVCGLWPIS